jgi:hypothetical protein
MRHILQAKRVLKSGGKFVCLTLAESHVLGTFLSSLTFFFSFLRFIFLILILLHDFKL